MTKIDRVFLLSLRYCAFRELNTFKQFFHNNIFICRSLVDGENGKTNQKWITKSFHEDFDIITIKTSSQKRRANVTFIGSFATSNLCWAASRKSFLPSSGLPPPGSLKMIKRCGHPLITSQQQLVYPSLVYWDTSDFTISDGTFHIHVTSS